MAATIKDVAKLAGTSVSAVSAVISANGRHNIRVGAATRQRICAAARELGFTPNPLAQSLVTRRTGVLGLVFPYSHAFVDQNPFSTQTMSGVFEEVVRNKYNLMLHTSMGDDWSEWDETALLDPRVDGLILVLPTAHNHAIERLRREQFPFVAVVYAPESTDDCAVNADDFGGGRLAAEHLISLGHKRIAHLMGDARIASAEPRKAGFLRGMDDWGLRVDPGWLVSASFGWKGGMEAADRILDLPLSRRPTAIFAANDLCAEGAMRAIRARGMTVPDDMAIVGFDDTWYAGMTQPALTSVRMPIAEMSATATRMLIDIVAGNTIDDRQPVLPVSLTIRESSGAKSAQAR